MTHAGERRDEQGSVGAAEVDCEVEAPAREPPLQAEGTPPRRAWFSQRINPDAVDRRDQLEDLGPYWCRYDMDLCPRVMSSEFVKGRYQVNGVAKKAKIDDQNRARLAMGRRMGFRQTVR